LKKGAIKKDKAKRLREGREKKKRGSHRQQHEKGKSYSSSFDLCFFYFSFLFPPLSA
jgi:hypothetical protein